MKNIIKLIFILMVLQICLIVFASIQGCIENKQQNVSTQQDSTTIDSTTIDTTINSISIISKSDTNIFEKVYLKESPIWYNGGNYTYFLGDQNTDTILFRWVQSTHGANFSGGIGYQIDSQNTGVNLSGGTNVNQSNKFLKRGYWRELKK